MSRPIYENSQTLSAEGRAADLLASRFDVTLQKLPISYHIDFAAFGPEGLKAWVEIKCRTNARLAYPTYLLSALKWTFGKMLACASDRPFVLVVEWTDAIGYCDTTKTPDLKIMHGGRTDRNDAADREPCVHIPIERFKLF